MAQKLLTLADVARQCGRTPNSVQRWASKGLKGVQLAVTYRGGSPRVRPEDLEAFFAKVTAAKRPARGDL